MVTVNHLPIKKRISIVRRKLKNKAKWRGMNEHVH